MSACGSASRIIWIDCEMTGLVLAKSTLVEVACIITEGNLEVVAEGPDIVIHHPDYVLDRMSAWCKSTFTKNGLLDAIRSSKISMEAAEKEILSFLNKYTKKGQCCLAGNSVSVDRLFIDKYMPSVGQHLHYRTIDVSSIKEVVKRWYPEKYKQLPAKREAHLALSDIRESIEELKWYKQNVFI
uniref:Probable oligoribonuclease n=1 Tax=Syphacia muris TaxID=451379 RepID=A0A0N5AYC4_9BILA